MIKFVISKYKEDISWVNTLKFPYIIYNKDESDLTNKNFINLPNKGREAHTYLTHIIDNYDRLDEITCFLQGYPFDHPTYPLPQLLNGINVNISFEDFLPFGGLQTCDLNGGPQNPYLDINTIFFDKYFLNKPEFINYAMGAQFMVSKNAILKRKKIFYKNLLEDFNRTDIPELLTKINPDIDPHAHSYIQKTKDDNRMPWLLERVWNIIFNENYISKFDS
jgi:hypothetical protein